MAGNLTAGADFREHQDWQAFARWAADVLNNCTLDGITIIPSIRVNVGLRVLALHEQGTYVSEQTIRDMAAAEQTLHNNIRH